MNNKLLLPHEQHVLLRSLYNAGMNNSFLISASEFETARELRQLGLIEIFTVMVDLTSAVGQRSLLAMRISSRGMEVAS